MKDTSNQQKFYSPLKLFLLKKTQDQKILMKS